MLKIVRFAEKRKKGEIRMHSLEKKYKKCLDKGFKLCYNQLTAYYRQNSKKEGISHA